MGFTFMILHSQSLLPHDGEALYYAEIPAFVNQSFLDILSNTLNWNSDTVIMFGILRELRRKSAWYGDQHAVYTYGGIQRNPLPWTPELLHIKQTCEELAHTSFNSVLCNYYHDGNDGMGWHRDNERELGHEPIIASVSFGVSRPFAFKHRISKERIQLQLNHGSLLIMRGQCQQAWLHSLPKTTKVKEPRINLTFRNILM